MDTKNSVVLIGRLVADPSLRYLENGTAVGGFSIAVNRSTRKPDGSFEDSLDGFFDCEIFGGLAETVAETLKKGNVVQVSGSLLQKKFKTRNGQQVSRVEIRARTIGRVLEAPRAAAPQNGQAAAVPEAAPVAQPAAEVQEAQIPQPA